MLLTFLAVILLSTVLGAAICAGAIQLVLRFMGRPHVVAQQATPQTPIQ